MGHNSVIDLLKTAQFCDAGPLAESWREEVVEKLWRLVVMRWFGEDTMHGVC